MEIFQGNFHLKVSLTQLAIHFYAQINAYHYKEVLNLHIISTENGIYSYVYTRLAQNIQFFMVSHDLKMTDARWQRVVYCNYKV